MSAPGGSVPFVSRPSGRTSVVVINRPGNAGPQGEAGPQGVSGAIGSQGTQGASGQQGPTGPQGPPGDVGAQGTTGQQGPPGVEGIQGPQGLGGALGPQGPQGQQGLEGVQGQIGSQGPQGHSGTQGPPGVQGISGPQGAQGPQGVQGLAGIQGSTGVQGIDGPQGLQGQQGPQGTQGDVGIQGFTGAQGPGGGSQGPQGIDGAQGIQGEPGPQGTQGPVGQQGGTGIQGPQGEGTQGPQGDSGAQGDVGSQGPQGGEGVQGPQGDSGPIGAQGAQGELGPQGAQGEAGGAGVQGPQGEIGAQGDVGAQGSQGIAGVQGQSGELGPQGSQGEAGTLGAQGPQGDAGATGSQGSQGPQGIAGEQGFQGTEGPQGEIGAQGFQGGEGPQFLEGNTLFVDSVYGVDATAVPNSPANPYLTPLAAANAALPGDTVMVRPGTYVTGGLARNGVSWYLAPGAILEASSTLFAADGSAGAFSFDVAGYGQFVGASPTTPEGTPLFAFSGANHIISVQALSATNPQGPAALLTQGQHAFLFYGDVVAGLSLDTATDAFLPTFAAVALGAGGGGYFRARTISSGGGAAVLMQGGGWSVEATAVSAPGPTAIRSTGTGFLDVATQSVGASNAAFSGDPIASAISVASGSVRVTTDTIISFGARAVGIAGGTLSVQAAVANNGTPGLLLPLIEVTGGNLTMRADTASAQAVMLLVTGGTAALTVGIASSSDAQGVILSGDGALVDLVVEQMLTTLDDAVRVTNGIIKTDINSATSILGIAYNVLPDADATVVCRGYVGTVTGGGTGLSIGSSASGWGVTADVTGARVRGETVAMNVFASTTGSSLMSGSMTMGTVDSPGGAGLAIDNSSATPSFLSDLFFDIGNLLAATTALSLTATSRTEVNFRIGQLRSLDTGILVNTAGSIDAVHAAFDIDRLLAEVQCMNLTGGGSTAVLDMKIARVHAESTTASGILINNAILNLNCANLDCYRTAVTATGGVFRLVADNASTLDVNYTAFVLNDMTEAVVRVGNALSGGDVFAIGGTTATAEVDAQSIFSTTGSAFVVSTTDANARIALKGDVVTASEAVLVSTSSSTVMMSCLNSTAGSLTAIIQLTGNNSARHNFQGRYEATGGGVIDIVNPVGAVGPTIQNAVLVSRVPAAFSIDSNTAIRVAYYVGNMANNPVNSATVTPHITPNLLYVDPNVN